VGSRLPAAAKYLRGTECLLLLVRGTEKYLRRKERLGAALYNHGTLSMVHKLRILILENKRASRRELEDDAIINDMHVQGNPQNNPHSKKKTRKKSPRLTDYGVN